MFKIKIIYVIILFQILYIYHKKQDFNKRLNYQDKNIKECNKYISSILKILDKYQISSDNKYTISK